MLIAWPSVCSVSVRRAEPVASPWGRKLVSAPEVVARYRTQGITVVDSAHCGAMQWQSAQAQGMRCERDTARRYWHHNAP